MESNESITRMPDWMCGIAGCEAGFDAVEDLLVHQVVEHEKTVCKICGAAIPDGFFAIRHMFTEHDRAQYARAYTPDPGEIRWREAVKETIEEEADKQAFRDRLPDTTNST